MKVTCTPLGMFHIKKELEELFPHLDLNFTKGIAGKSETEELLMLEEYAVIGSEVLDADFLKKTKLKMIVRFGGSLENIDLDAANQNNIKVMNFKSATVANEVANLTLSFIIDASYNCSCLEHANKDGRWFRPMVLGSQARVSIFGSGQIGQLVSEKLANIGFQNVDINSMRSLLSVENYCSNFKKIIENSDIVVLNASYLSWDKSTFDKALSSSNNLSLINTARGNLLNETKVLEYLDEGLLKNFYSDVTSTEPPDAISQKLINHKNAYITPHIGGYSKKSLMEVGEATLGYFKESLND